MKLTQPKPMEIKLSDKELREFVKWSNDNTTAKKEEMINLRKEVRALRKIRKERNINYGKRR